MSFEETYRQLLGERWSRLRPALVERSLWGVRRNPFVAGHDPGGEDLPSLPGVRVAREPFPAAPLDPDTGLVAWYAQDPASVAAALALGVEPGQRVLDLCAAPGGKTLVLAAALGEHGELVANDRSAARRTRLARVLDEHLPSALRARVQVTGHDATRWSLHERDAYDRVLLDAPCSSEAHVLADPRALRQWSPARSRQLARRQYAMLAAALDAVRPGGRILYSTCALAPAENDGVVERLLTDRRRSGRSAVLPAPTPLGEPTTHGRLILPDEGGLGPIYLALLERRA